MKRKISMVIDSEIVRLAKGRAAKEGRTLSELIREALTSYLRRNATTPQERKIAYRLFCERPMKISPSQLRYVLEDDLLDLEWRGFQKQPLKKAGKTAAT
jgi:hypothetical protein